MRHLVLSPTGLPTGIPASVPIPVGWLWDEQIPTPKTADLLETVEHFALLSGLVDPLVALRSLDQRTLLDDRATLTLSHALATRLSLGICSIAPIRRLWARHARPTQRAQLLIGGGLTIGGPWWENATFAAEAAEALSALSAAGVSLSSMSKSLSQLQCTVGGPAASSWPTGVWLRLWLLVYERTSLGPAAVHVRDVALVQLNARVVHGPWSPTAEDLVPLLRAADAEIRVWAQCALAGLPPHETAFPSTVSRTAIDLPEPGEPR